jgi:hypothetical protein
VSGKYCGESEFSTLIPKPINLLKVENKDSFAALNIHNVLVFFAVEKMV